MRINKIENFKKFEVEHAVLISLKGGVGLCTCKQAAPYACETAGYIPGTGAFYNCMVDIYTDCMILDPSCSAPQ